MKETLSNILRRSRDAIVSSARALRRGVAFVARFAWRSITAEPLLRFARAVIRFVASLGRIAIWSAALALLAFGFVWFGFERVPLGAIGVMQEQWGDGGIVAHDFEPGLHRSWRYFESWHRLDGRTHFLCFGFKSDGCDLPVLDLRTKDGNEVKVSATVPYHIKRGEGWQLVRDGLKSSYASLARTTVESVLMQEFAHLSTSDFTDTDLRLARCSEALPRLNALLAPYHLEAETIQMHQTQFWIEYEKKLQSKQLTHQEALDAGAAAEVEEERRRETLANEIDNEEKKVRAQFDNDIETANAEAQLAIAKTKSDARSYDVVTRAKADADSAKEIAAGDLAIDKAEALKDELTHKVYDTSGGRILLAREAATNLRITHVTLDAHDPRVPNVLDLDAMVALLVGKKSASEAKP